MQKNNGPYAEVIAGRGVRQLFTYAVPELLMDRALQGCRVVVPFGNRKIIGLVAGRVETTEVRTKPIIDLVDETAIIPPDLLALGLWTADYYFASPGDIFGALLPRGDVTVRRMVELRENAVPPTGRSRRAAELYGILLAKKSRSVDQLRSGMELTGAQLSRLLKSDAVVGFASVRDVAHKVLARNRDKPAVDISCESAQVALTDAQQEVYENIARDIDTGTFMVSLIHGVTGSGKTEVYAHLIQKTLDAGRSVLVMAPEMALADTLARRLGARTGEVPVTLHSGLTPRARADNWDLIQSGQRRFVVGARSAVFAPLRDLGLVIVDEEHDHSYKQESHARYHGRDVAIKRASLVGCPLVLGSATPALESYYNARSGKYRMLNLADRIDGRPLPEVRLVRPEEPGKIGESLESEMQLRLDRNEQTMIFINRRGAARFVVCNHCGYAFECRNCSLSLIYHAGVQKLRCHTCGYEEPVPKRCPTCGGDEFYRGGSGSESVEREVTERFGAARVARMDRDTTGKRGVSAKILSSMAAGEIDVLIGTQMITKGHDFHGVTLVGAVSADETLHLPDFRSSERTFAALTQAAGRAGRGERPGVVIAQAVSVGHHSVMTAARHDYEAFYAAELPVREMAGYPPFVRLAQIRIDAPSERSAQPMLAVARREAELLNREGGVQVLGPVEAIVFKTRNRYQWRMLFKGNSHISLRKGVARFLERIESVPKRGSVNVMVDVDPMSVM